MGDGADDCRATEEMWEELRWEHKQGCCNDDCSYCDPDFKPLFQHEAFPVSAVTGKED